MAQKIVFATGNEGKMREVRLILEDLGMEILSMKEAGAKLSIAEDGATFGENAELKARAVWEHTGGIVLADDSGLVVDYLNGEPGIYSARYMGEETPYSIKNQEIIRRLEGAAPKERTARFISNIAAVLPNGRVLHTEAAVEGTIACEPAGSGGFGYDPIFFLPEYGKTAAEIPIEEKNRISHRGKALEAMKNKLKEIYGRGRKMKILIVSDTHRKDENLKTVIEKTKPFDMLIHLGDAEGSEETIATWLNEECRLEMVLGNNDFFSCLDREKELWIGRYKVLLTHGHYYNVSLDPEFLRKEAVARGFDIAMFGHTHRPYLSREGGVTVLNPGSLSYPRQDGRKPSYMIMELDEGGEAHFTQNYLEKNTLGF